MAAILQILIAPLQLLATQPIITGPLVYALTYYPQQVQAYLPEQLALICSTPLLLYWLWFLFVLGGVRKVNTYLSSAVLNNFTASAWVEGQEIVLITGGSSGLGESLTHELAPHAAKIIVFDLAPSKKPLPSNAFFYAVNVTSSAAIAAAAATIREDHGAPTVLINNAGILSGFTILDSPEELIRRTFDVNIVAHFLLVKEFLPAMIEKDHGHVVTVASMSSFVVVPQIVDYAATKAAALAFHEGLAGELKERYGARNVKTSIIHPTWVRTPLIAKMAQDGKFNTFTLAPEIVVQAMVKHLLAGQSGQLIVPPPASLFTGIRGWPSWLQQLARDAQASTLTVKGGLR